MSVLSNNFGTLPGICNKKFHELLEGHHNLYLFKYHRLVMLLHQFFLQYCESRKAPYQEPKMEMEQKKEPQIPKYEFDGPLTKPSIPV